jgi:tetratricopeptide (TPR) repeat protein
MRWLLAILLLCAALPATAVHAQTLPGQEAPSPEEALRRRIEALSRSGRGDEAIAILEARREEGTLSVPLARRLVRLYRDAGRWGDIEELLFELTPREEDMDFGDLRQLAEARYRLDRRDEARRALERAIDLDPENASQVAVISNIYAQWGDYDRAIEVLLEARERIGLPTEFAQSLSRHYSRRGDPVDALREACLVVAAGPLNLAIMRGQVVQIVQEDPAPADEYLDAVRSVREAYPGVPQLAILLAEVALVVGEDELAWNELRPLVADPAMGQDLLRIAIAGLADSGLPGADPGASLRRLGLSVRICRGLLGNETLPRSLEPRAHDTLVRSMLAVLDNQAFGELAAEERGQWLEDSRLAVLEMNESYPGNRMAEAATLRLAEVYTDALGDADKAIELFDAVAQDPSASAENISLARLGLARAYVVSGDTLRAREAFARIGADQSDPAAQSRAQYHLGLLDFMGGEFEEAEDRLKAVALKSPRASFTNDALDLAILIAEENFGGAPDEDGLRMYGVMLYQRATHQRDEMQATLGEIAERDLSPVRDRARLNLAEWHEAQGEEETALYWVDRLVDDSPMSRDVPRALDLRAGVLLGLGREEQARETLERILLEYEDYVMVDRVRDRLAALRQPGEDAPEGEVP